MSDLDEGLENDKGEACRQNHVVELFYGFQLVCVSLLKVWSRLLKQWWVNNKFAILDAITQLDKLTNFCSYTNYFSQLKKTKILSGVNLLTLLFYFEG